MASNVKTFSATIKLRKDTEENWTSQNPLLLNGEKAVVVTASGAIRHKTGDGIHTYTDLAFDDEDLYNSIAGPRSKSIDVVLSSRSWSDTNTQNITVDGVTTTTNGIASLPQNMTDEQYDAAALSGLYISGQGENFITFKCRSGAPTIDIPITIIIFQ